MKLRWESGRRGTGYRKLALVRRARWDLYLIDYPVGAYVPEHKDPVPGRRHWRANLRLVGDDAFEGEVRVRLGRLVIFRPDVTPHAVERVRRRRVVLSFGIAL